MSDNMYDINIFSGFLWSPSKLLWKNIIKDINESNQVIKYLIYDFDDLDTFENNIINIYKTDDISIDKIKNIKLNSMKKYTYTFLYFEIKIDNPKYRIKNNGSDISQVVEHIKLNIRNKYKDKINNYIHDIIIHITDNSLQTTEIQTIIKTFDENIENEFVNLKYLLKIEYNYNMFNRVDLLVRKYSIKQYLNDVNYDFNFYKKMQINRLNEFAHTTDRINNFKKLLKLLSVKGFDNNYPILCYSNYKLYDGAHRLSYLYFKKETFICVERMSNIGYIEYSRQWFVDNNFNEKELSIIDKELLELDMFIHC